MRSTQITTWRRYTAAEKKAYRARQMRRHCLWLESIFGEVFPKRHHFADNLGSRVPAPRVNRGFL
jgi:hypothetical protein